MNNTEKLNDKAWEDLAVNFSKGEVDVDKAWNKLNQRISESDGKVELNWPRIRNTNNSLLRIAAIVVILIGLGSTALYLNNRGLFSKKIVAETTVDEKNRLVELPDGSKIYLNRNSRLTYKADFNKSKRSVALSGEAFFEIAPDASNPFMIDAGKASVKVLGTSFNVITSNPDSEVEVFVKTGKVLLADNSGEQSQVLEPGSIGKVDNQKSSKEINSNPNYLSWKTGLLVYKGETLDVVFNDLKRVYNMDIVADDKSIIENPWNAPIDNETPETIIRLICTSFNLSYSMEGNVYHLTKK